MNERIESICKFLSGHGFSVTESHNDYIKLCLLNDNDTVRAGIGLSQTSLYPSEVFVQVDLSTHTLVDSECWYDSVHREIGPNGQFPYGSHAAHGWSLVSLESLSSALENDILPFLFRHLDIEKLIITLEDLVANGEEYPAMQQKAGLARTLLGELGLIRKHGAKADVIFAPRHLECLAYLHYSIGDYDKSADYIERWLSHCNEQDAIEYKETLAKLRHCANYM